jgi:hypothetical protein
MIAVVACQPPLSSVHAWSYDVPENVPPEIARKALNGTVRPRKAGYLLCRTMTAAEPASVPITPPKMPPETVALMSSLVY